MRQPAQVRFLPDRKRLHLSDGPIDLIIEGFGDPVQVRACYRQAADRFATILDELCSELSLIRQPIQRGLAFPAGVVARRMAEAVAPYAERCFVTPMAAVAGSIAEEVLNAMTANAAMPRAYVNNGGDIAFHLARGEEFVAGMIERSDHPSLFGTARLHYDQHARGIATSGWGGRSFSLGIADAVTVLASTASQADAAATVIANAVDLPTHPGICRKPANELVPDSDLGEIPVTCAVPALAESEIEQALNAGMELAEVLLSTNLITGAALCLQGRVRLLPAGLHLDRALWARTPHPELRSPLHA